MKGLFWLCLVILVIGLGIFLAYPDTTVKDSTKNVPTPVYVPTSTPTPSVCVPRHESFDVWLPCPATPTPK